MTEHEVREIDEQIAAMGLTYNPRSELFQTVPRGDTEAEPVEWEDVLFAAPDLSLNDLAAYEKRKQGRRTTQAANTTG